MTSATGTESAPHDAASDALWQQDTQALHAGYRGREQQRSAAVPIYQSTSFVFDSARSEEHTSELQSHSDLVCRLLLEKKKKNTKVPILTAMDRWHSST